MSEKLKVRSKKTGKVHEIEWDGPSSPTQDDIKRLIGEKELPTISFDSPPKSRDPRTISDPYDPDFDPNLAPGPGEVEDPEGFEARGSGLAGESYGKLRELLQQGALKAGSAVRSLPIFSQTGLMKPTEDLTSEDIKNPSWLSRALSVPVEMATEPSSYLVPPVFKALPNLGKKVLGYGLSALGVGAGAKRIVEGEVPEGVAEIGLGALGAFGTHRATRSAPPIIPDVLPPNRASTSRQIPPSGDKGPGSVIDVEAKVVPSDVTPTSIAPIRPLITPPPKPKEFTYGVEETSFPGRKPPAHTYKAANGISRTPEFGEVMSWADNYYTSIAELTKTLPVPQLSGKFAGALHYNPRRTATGELITEAVTHIMPDGSRQVYVDPMNLAKTIYLDMWKYPTYAGQHGGSLTSIGREFRYKFGSALLHEHIHVMQDSATHGLNIQPGMEGESVKIHPTSGSFRGKPTVKQGPFTGQERFDILNHIVRDVEGSPLYKLLEGGDDALWGRAAESFLSARSQAHPERGRIQGPSFEEFAVSVPERAGMVGDYPAGSGLERHPVGEVRATLQENVGEVDVDLKALEQTSGQPPPSIPPAISKKLKPIPPSIDRKVWVNQRKAAELEGAISRDKFKKLDTLGFQGILDYNKDPTSTPEFSEVKNYFDQRLARLRAIGIPIGFKENYLPQIWKDPPGTVNAVYRKLGLRPSFTLDAVFKNYEEGKAAGLTPEFNTIGELVGWYEQRSKKLEADWMYYQGLKQQKKLRVVRPGGAVPEGWDIVDPKHFPFIRMRGALGKKVPDRILIAPKDEAQFINNYLRDPEELGGLPKALSKSAKVITVMKNLGMSAGVPGTSLTAHGFNVRAIDFLFSQNPLKSVARSIAWSLPHFALKRMRRDIEKMPFFIKSGLRITTEDYDFLFREVRKSLGTKLNEAEGLKTKGRIILNHLFEEPTFQFYIPAIKMEYVQAQFKFLKKSGLSDNEAATVASKNTNEIFGGLNLEEIGRDKNWQNFWRTVLVAPDFTETQFARTPRGVAKAIANPKNPRYRAYLWAIRNLALTYVGMTILNKALSGHYMHENQEGNEFSVETGGKDSKGKTEAIRVLGSGAQFAQAPYNIARKTFRKHPDFGAIPTLLRNRLSPGLQPLVNLIKNTDYAGEPIFGKDRYGRPIKGWQQVMNALGELNRMVFPQVRAAAGVIKGDMSGKEATATGLELPVSYRRKKRNRSNQLPSIPPPR